MKLSKFIQIKIFSRLIVLYLITILSFLFMSIYGFHKEMDRYFTISSGFISSSTQQLVNEGDTIRAQMNIDQFASQLNESSAFKICPKVFLDGLLIAKIECKGRFTKSNNTTWVMNNSKKLVIDLDIDYDYFILSLVLKIVIFSIFSFGVLVFIKRSIDRFAEEITLPLNKWSDWAKKLSFNQDIVLPEFTDNELNIHEFKNFNEFTQKTFELQKDFYTIKMDSEKSKAVTNLAKQVAHDIRSPLTTLKMVLEEVNTIPTEHRSMIQSSVQRINDIANNLLSANKGKSYQDQTQLSVELLAPLVDSLISEKRMQYRNKNNIEIVTDLSESYGLFANINSIELSRVLSNIITNSVEAIETKGIITVKISEVGNRLLLSISDNGKGIPESILNKIGEAGFSHGKTETDSGSGLGIHHAKASIEAFGGVFEIKSTVEIGTVINIFLPKAHAPDWFVNELLLNDDQLIFILDDDDSIHKLWAERLPKNIMSFTSGEQFSLAIEKVKGQKFICLVDYELLGQSHNGLEIIQKLQIADQSILVTSRFEEKEIRSFALKLGVRLIPKNFASLIPVKSQPHNDFQFFDYVFIDDDKILRIGWERRAHKNKNNIKLLTLTSTSEFKQHTNKISKENTKVYIDSDLGEGEMRGEDFAKSLHEEGYQQLYISSGYEAENFAHLPWLKFAGKDCPF